MPTLSVIIPCYNHGKFLDEAVGSVEAQTFRDLEIVVVNDGSTDRFTRRRLAEFARPSARVLHVPHGGKAAAVNAGIRESSGRYLLVLDADDRIAPTYAQKGVRVLEERPEVGVVYCDAELFGKKSGPWPLPEFDLELMLRRNLIFATAFFRREDWEAVGGFDVDVRNEDYDFWLSLLERGRAVHKIPEVLFEVIRDLKLEIARRIEALPHKRVGAGLKRLVGQPRP